MVGPMGFSAGSPAQMFAQAGQTFLDSMAKGHGATIGSRILRPYQDFETPWGKGPYWNEWSIPALQRRQFDASMRSFKKWKIHPLFGLGSSANFSPSVGSEPRGGRPGPQGTASNLPSVPQKVSALEAQLVRSQVQKNIAESMYWSSKAAQERQAAGGAPSAGIDVGAGEKLIPPAADSEPLSKRPTLQTPKRSSPKTQELRDEFNRRYKVYHPDAQADELNQAWLVFQELNYAWDDYKRTIPKARTHGLAYKNENAVRRRAMERAGGRWKKRDDELRRRRQMNEPRWMSHLRDLVDMLWR